MRKIVVLVIAAFSLTACEDIGEAIVINRETIEPVCHEDQAKVVAPYRKGVDKKEGLRWVCVNLDDFADEDSMARLDAILANK